MATLVPEGYSLDLMKKYASHFLRPPHTTFSTSPSSVADAREPERLARQAKAAQVAEDYYNLVSPLYEQGWGQRFHYTPLTPGLSIQESMTVYEREFARIAGLKRGMRVLDLGCGVGGPARSIARLVGCEVVGVSNTPWHVERGEALTREEGLEGLVGFVEGDYMVCLFFSFVLFWFYALVSCPVGAWSSSVVVMVRGWLTLMCG